MIPRLRPLVSSPVKTLASALVLFGLVSCGQKPAEGAPEPKKGEPVTFTLEISPEPNFSPTAEIRVSILDGTELDLLRAGSGCVVSMDTSGQEKTECPPGVTYHKPAAETFSFTPADLKKPLEITSKTVTTGERFKISVGGKAPDGCNNSGAHREGVASDKNIRITDLSFAQTEIACLPAPK